MTPKQFSRFNLSMMKECIGLYRQVFSKEPWLEESSYSDVERYFINSVESNKFLGYVMIRDEKIIAFSVGFLKPWIKGEEYYIDQFCVDYNLQGQGIGSILMDEIKKDLIKDNIHAIILSTERNVPAYKFYIKNGFRCLDDLCFLGTEF